MTEYLPVTLFSASVVYAATGVDWDVYQPILFTIGFYALSSTGVVVGVGVAVAALWNARKHEPEDDQPDAL